MSKGSDDVPGLLYHYTSGEALLGILTSTSLWATDSAYLNDTREFTFGREELAAAIRELAKRIADRVPESPLHDSPAEIADHVRPLADQVDGPLEGPYITSFCRHPDLLSQWRSYGRNGYSIGFRSDALQTIAAPKAGRRYNGVEEEVDPTRPNQPPALRRVRYGEGSVSAMVEAVIYRYEALSGVPRSPLYGIDDLAFLYAEVASVKDNAFEQEDEWRLILHPGATLPKYRVDAQSTLIPYIPLPFDRTAVEEIWVGPGMHEGAESSLERFLEQHEYQHVKVKKSKAPYRG